MAREQPKQRTVYILKEIAAAGIGCALVDSLFNPLEVLKVRLQNSSGLSNTSQMVAMAATAKTIVRCNGYSGLWLPGLFPTILRGIFYVGVRIGTYPTAKLLLPNVVPAIEPDSFFNKLIAGAMCGTLGSTLFTPLDVIRIRFQAYKNAYPSTLAAFGIIASNEGGMQSLWRGGFVNILRATSLSGAQLSIYDQLKVLAKGYSSITPTSNCLQSTKGVGLKSFISSKITSEGPLLHATASFASGTVAQFIIMPIDTLKTRIMLSYTRPKVTTGEVHSHARQRHPAGIQPGSVRSSFAQNDALVCIRKISQRVPVSKASRSSTLSQFQSQPGSVFGVTSLRGCAVAILKAEGIAGFYRGLAPAIMRQGPCILLQVPVIC